ncbi:hypothetical protein SLNWT_2308 [Streptomyces albus]|uniref:Uncharacterized protein n=1 Tax=Streptomyces albus (strain ATCC 21838 / DSM 41398 / FERM P-419 / JCM 4703 / NBRC 107858) TaxID=1081613 RepID=A0A0B5EM94_STRA4|nr:hypothetical protein SLNWT_2308 [Streptomyces albus]AOU76997.1 hypothetical protein SLNHY_2306 [Streptomyces albus]AYN32773.1 hypothetical protein DUI70_2270 [Streptomyces albus]
MWFDAPETFFALPLGDTHQERMDRAQIFVRDLFAEGDEQIWEPAIPYYEALAEYLTDNGLSYSAVGLFSTDQGGVAQCAFTVAALETDQDDPETAARGILAALSTDPFNDVRWMDLPCGPAVSSVLVREVGLAPEITASGEDEKLVSGQIQVHIPFPTGPYTAVFTLNTTSVDYWGEFCDLMSAILKTVSFTEPDDREDLTLPAQRQGGPASERAATEPAGP